MVLTDTQLDGLLAAGSSPDFEGALSHLINWLLKTLPYEGAAIVLYEPDLKVLQGYAGGGIFDDERVLNYFVFSAHFSSATTQEPPYPIQLAWKALTSPDKFHDLQCSSNIPGQLLQHDGRSGFFISDVPTCVESQTLVINPVYREGRKLLDFAAFLMNGSKRENEQPVGLVVFNNLTEQSPRPFGSCEGQSLDHSPRPPAVENIVRGSRIAELVRLVLASFSLRYEHTKAEILFDRLRKLADLPLNTPTNESDNMRQGLEHASHIISEEMHPDWAATFYVHDSSDSSGLETLWENRPTAADHIKEHLSNRANRNSLKTQLSEHVSTFHAALLFRKDESEGLRSSSIVLKLWEDETGKKRVLLSLLRERQPKSQRTSDNAIYLREDRMVLERAATEVHRWMNVLQHASDVERIRREHWRGLARNATHKLKQPISNIMFNLQSVLEEGRASGKPELRDALAETQRLKGLVDEFLGFIGGGKASPAWEKPTLLIEEAIQQVFGNERTSETDRISICVDQDIPEMFLDSRHFSAAVEELLFNAKKHSQPDSPIVIEATTESGRPDVPSSDKEACLVFRVQSAGQIPSALLEEDRLFEPFVTGDKEGTGIGLAYVREVAQAHSGNVTVKGTERDRTTFTLYLPLRSESTTPSNEDLP